MSNCVMVPLALKSLFFYIFRLELRMYRLVFNREILRSFGLEESEIKQVGKDGRIDRRALKVEAESVAVKNINGEAVSVVNGIVNKQMEVFRICRI
ncbi:MAG: hypothetical protein R3F11_07775 [Verrucomicrobiales bacterium]